MGTAAIAAAGLAICGPARAGSGDCIDLPWDLGRELALFRGTAARIEAGREANAAPRVEVNRLYRVDLAAQPTVRFAHAPGGRRTVENASAGIRLLEVPAEGHLRVSIDGPA